MSIIQHVRNKKAEHRLQRPDRLGCHLNFIQYDKAKLLSIQEKFYSHYAPFYENPKYSNVQKQQRSEMPLQNQYKVLRNEFIGDEPYCVSIKNTIKEAIPLLADVQISCQFSRFEQDTILLPHSDWGRNVAIFLPLTENSAPTVFYKDNLAIKSFDHSSPLLLAVDTIHGSHNTSTKITFQLGFYYTKWDQLLDFCLGLNK
jgi:hypothetical protein